MAEAPASADAVVVAAMPEELRPLRALLADPRPVGGDFEMSYGQLAGRRVVLVVTGDGPRNARAGTDAALARTRARSLIAIGVAGALSPDLAPGDLVAVRRVVRERGGTLCATPSGLDAVARGARPAVAVTAERIADSVAEKRRLLGLAQPEPGVAAIVDLESAAYAEAAAAAAIPWLILRAVSDTAHEALPNLLNQAMDNGGAVRRGRVLAGLLGQPLALPRLLVLRRRVNACAETLAGGAALVIGQLPIGLAL